MARVKIEDIIDYLDSDFKKALARAVSQELPGASFNEGQLFRTFKRRLAARCSVWETVPDRYVEVSDR